MGLSGWAPLVGLLLAEFASLDGAGAIIHLSGIAGAPASFRMPSRLPMRQPLPRMAPNVGT
ncbi:hypothetical protein D9599_16815 [Roseomonas sp. KE2513]|nr:hypothetical protein [Roseomonas sp. KE2513]